MQLRDMTDRFTVDKLQNAEVDILKYVQKQTFSEENSSTKKQKCVRKSSNCYRLSPVMTDSELFCIECRLRNSKLSDLNNQIISDNTVL